MVSAHRFRLPSACHVQRVHHWQRLICLAADIWKQKKRNGYVFCFFVVSPNNFQVIVHFFFFFDCSSRPFLFKLSVGGYFVPAWAASLSVFVLRVRLLSAAPLLFPSLTRFSFVFCFLLRFHLMREVWPPFFSFFFIVLSYNAADFYAHVQLTKRGSVWLEFESRPLSTFDFLFCRISATHQPLVWPVKGRSEC